LGQQDNLRGTGALGDLVLDQLDGLGEQPGEVGHHVGILAEHDIVPLEAALAAQVGHPCRLALRPHEMLEQAVAAVILEHECATTTDSGLDILLLVNVFKIHVHGGRDVGDERILREDAL